MPSVVTRRHTLFFAKFPLEIRQQVYEHVLATAPYGSTQLLLVCSQIYSEAQQYLFKRPVTFQSQSDFLRWAHSVPRGHLFHVTTVRLRLVDMGSDELFRIFRRRLALAKVAPPPDSPPLVPYHEECERQMAKIEAALRCLPNIQDFTILETNSPTSWPCEYMHTIFLRLIARVYPRLWKFTLHAAKMSLSPLQSYKNLRSLTFCGWSTSTPSETSLALQQIHSLQAIEVFGSPPGLAFEQRPGYTDGRWIQSFNSEVLRNIHPLRSFAIWDLQDHPYDDRPFLTDELFDALGTQHASLQTLKVRTKGRPWKNVEKFGAYLQSSSLLCLECSSDLTELGIAEILPRSLEILAVLPSPHNVGPLVNGLLQRHGELPAMREIILLRAAAEDPAFAEAMAKFCKMLRKRGILLNCEEARLHPCYRRPRIPFL